MKSVVGIDAIRNHPDVATWKSLILGLVEGRSGGLTYRLGSVEETIDVARREAGQADEAGVHFHEALRELVISWRPRLLPARLRNEGRMMEVVAAYTPSPALPKLLAFFQTACIQYLNVLGTDDKIGKEFAGQCLRALDAFFPPSSAIKDSSGAEEYSKIMFSLLQTQFAPRALRRLLETGLISYRDKELSATFDLYPDETLVEVLRSIISVRTPTRGHVLSWLFDVSIRLDVKMNREPKMFERQAEAFGCSLRHGDQDPILETPTESLEILIIDEATLITYVTKMRSSHLYSQNPMA
jgi:hypothetical protein